MRARRRRLRRVATQKPYATPNARETVIADLIQSGRLSGFAFVPGVGRTDPEKLPKNLTGDRYHTDGYRGVAILEREDSTARFLEWAADPGAPQD